MVKIIWKHKEQLIEELCNRLGIRDPKDKRNLAKLNTNNLHCLLKAIDSDFRAFDERDDP